MADVIFDNLGTPVGNPFNDGVGGGFSAGNDAGRVNQSGNTGGSNGGELGEGRTPDGIDENPQGTNNSLDLSLKIVSSDITHGINDGIDLPITIERGSNIDKIVVFVSNTSYIYNNFSNTTNRVTVTIPKNIFTNIGRYKIVVVGGSVANEVEGNRDEVIVNVVDTYTINFPDLTYIEYPEKIEGPDFIGFDVNFNITWDSVATDYIKMSVGNKQNDKSTRLNPKGTQTFNIKKLLDEFPEINPNNETEFTFGLTFTAYSFESTKKVATDKPELVSGNPETYFITFSAGKYNIERSTAINLISSGFEDKFDDSVFEQETSKNLTHLLHINPTFVISNWIGHNNSLILKLYEPLPTDIEPNQLVWISKLQSTPIIETVTMVGEDLDYCPPLKGPNFSIDIDTGLGYKTFDEILGSDLTTSANLLSRLSGSSVIDTKKLNIEYASGSELVFSNFINYGSAAELINNFYYKVQLLETYQAKLDDISGGEGWTTSSTVSNYSNDLTFKIQNLKNTFNGFEYWLYNDTEYSDSLSYPKSSGTPVSSTSAEAVAWYGSLVDSASEFDKYNPNYIINNIPAFVREDADNSDFILFMDMIGSHYDVIWTYVNGIKNLKILEEKRKYGMSDEMVFHMLESLGWEVKRAYNSNFLWEYYLGQYENGTQKYGITLENANNQVWRRILNNLPYLLKHKGTKRAIHAIMACYGVPQSLLTVMEFGGPKDPTLGSTSKFTFEDRTSSIKVRSGNEIIVPWKQIPTLGYYPNAIELRFKPDELNNTATIVSIGQFDLKIVPTSASKGVVSFGLNDVTTQGNYLEEPFISASVSTTYFDYTSPTIVSASVTILNPLLDGEYDGYVLTPEGEISGSDFVISTEYWTNVLINKNDLPDGGARYDVYLQTATEDRILYDISSSLTTAVGPWESGGLTIAPDFSGSIDEFRLWRVPLEFEAFQNHTLFPDAINGNSYTASTADLMLRLDFELPKNRTAVDYDVVQYEITQSGLSELITSGNEYVVENGQYGYIYDDVFYNVSGSTWTNYIKNVAINEDYNAAFVTASNFYSAPRYPYQYISYDRTITADIPSSGFNLLNKIRLESQTTLDGRAITSDIEGTIDLSHKVRATKKSFDQAPIDSNRLGVFFSPNKELNMDIVKALGPFNIDNYIGSPSDDYKENYEDLKTLRTYYFDRLDRNINEYIRLVKYIDKSLFETMEQLVPARTAFSKGLLIEPHILERNKTRWDKPTSEKLGQETSIDVDENVKIELSNILEETELDLSTLPQLDGDKNDYLADVESPLPVFELDTTSHETEINFDTTELVQSSYSSTEAVINYEDTSNLVSTREDLESVIVNEDNTILEGSVPYYEQEIEVPNGAYVSGEYDSLQSEVIGMNPNSLSNRGFGLYNEFGDTILTEMDSFGNITRARKRVFRVKESYTVKVLTQTEGWPATTNNEPVKYEYVPETRYRYYLSLVDFATGSLGDPVEIVVGGNIVEAIEVNGYIPYHYKYTNNLSTGLERSYFKGSKQTAATTPDGLSPVETFTTNPNILRVAATGRGSGEPILEST